VCIVCGVGVGVGVVGGGRWQGGLGDARRLWCLAGERAVVGGGVWGTRRMPVHEHRDGDDDGRVD